jgi:hypothetical protein
MASRIEMSDRCCCEFVRAFEYDTASAHNIAADFAAMLAYGYVTTADFWGSGHMTRLGWSLRRSEDRKSVV